MTLPLRSIMSRICGGFLLIVLPLAVMAGAVWRAAGAVDEALRHDAASQTAEARVEAVHTALLEARLRMAGYVRTEGIAERSEAAGAIDRLQAMVVAADDRHDNEGKVGEFGPVGEFGQVGAAIRANRANLSKVAEAVAERHAAVAALVAATAALTNSGTALATAAVGPGDKALAQAGVALIADVAQAAAAASRAVATEQQAAYRAAYAAANHGAQLLTEIAEATAGAARIQRLADSADTDLHAMQAALTTVQVVTVRRGERVAELQQTALRAAAISDAAVQAIARDLVFRRAVTLTAQASLRRTVLWTTAAVGVLGLAVALGLSISITRPLARLAQAMNGLAGDPKGAAVPRRRVRDEVGALAGAVAAIQDRSAHLATHDVLTDLPNRILFRDRLEQAVAFSRREDASVAVLYLDLDHFKDVNNTLGHGIGDQLLVQVAARLAACVRRSDTLARLGGDEFALVQNVVRDPTEITALAQRLVEAMTEPFETNGHFNIIGTSIGISVRNACDLQLHQVDADLLLQEADVALYRAKEAGRGSYCFFAAEMNAKLMERRSMEDDIREALTLDQFRVHYQPQIDLARRCVVGAEALLRWRHPRRGNVSPGQFIPVAEETGLILQLGEWVLHEACRQAAAWPGLATMAVNVSPVQFRRPGFVEMVRHALQQADLAPSRLELEITEGVLLYETPETLAILQRLHNMGVAIAMDDFGTGYSSLGYLKKFRFDKIKIDQSFVSNLGRDPEAGEIVRAVLRMGQAMGIRVNAEGVEQEEQMQLLVDEGCEEAQGYLFGRPMPAEEFAEMLKQPMVVIAGK